MDLPCGDASSHELVLALSCAPTPECILCDTIGAQLLLPELPGRAARRNADEPAHPVLAAGSDARRSGYEMHPSALLASDRQVNRHGSHRIARRGAKARAAVSIPERPRPPS